MSFEKNIAIDKARRFIALLNVNGINVHEAYLFGSAALGLADEYSDIDVAIVSDSFAGIPFYDVKKNKQIQESGGFEIGGASFFLERYPVCPLLFFS